jgi:hypothetical protein
MNVPVIPRAQFSPVHPLRRSLLHKKFKMKPPPPPSAPLPPSPPPASNLRPLRRPARGGFARRLATDERHRGHPARRRPQPPPLIEVPPLQVPPPGPERPTSAASGPCRPPSPASAACPCQPEGFFVFK